MNGWMLIMVIPRSSQSERTMWAAARLFEDVGPPGRDLAIQNRSSAKSSMSKPYLAAALSFSGRLCTQARPREWEQIAGRGSISLVVGVVCSNGERIVVRGSPRQVECTNVDSTWKSERPLYIHTQAYRLREHVTVRHTGDEHETECDNFRTQATLSKAAR